MQILNNFPWAQTLGRRMAEWAPQLRSLQELQKLSLAEVNWAGGNPRLSNKFRPDRPFDLGGDASPISTTPAGRRTVVLSFNASDCLVNVNAVPVTQRQKTLGMLRLQLQGILPIAADRYVVGWHELDRTDRLSRVEHFVLKSTTLDDAIGQLAQKGYETKAIAFRHDGQSAIPIALLKDGTEFGEEAHSRWLNTVAWGLITVLFASWVIGVTNAKWHSENLAVLEDQGAQLLTEVQSLKAVQASMEKQAVTLIAARLARNSRHPISAVIEELSRIIPDHTYLTKIVVDGETVSIDGLSSLPEALVAILERSQIFKDVSFTAPVFRNPGENQSRFSAQMVFEKAAKK